MNQMERLYLLVVFGVLVASVRNLDMGLRADRNEEPPRILPASRWSQFFVIGNPSASEDLSKGYYYKVQENQVVISRLPPPHHSQVSALQPVQSHETRNSQQGQKELSSISNQDFNGRITRERIDIQKPETILPELIPRRPEEEFLSRQEVFSSPYRPKNENSGMRLEDLILQDQRNNHSEVQHFKPKLFTLGQNYGRNNKHIRNQLPIPYDHLVTHNNENSRNSDSPESIDSFKARNFKRLSSNSTLGGNKKIEESIEEQRNEKLKEKIPLRSVRLPVRGIRRKLASNERRTLGQHERAPADTLTQSVGHIRERIRGPTGTETLRNEYHREAYANKFLNGGDRTGTTSLNSKRAGRIHFGQRLRPIKPINVTLSGKTDEATEIDLTPGSELRYVDKTTILQNFKPHLNASYGNSHDKGNPELPLNLFTIPKNIRPISHSFHANENGYPHNQNPDHERQHIQNKKYFPRHRDTGDVPIKIRISPQSENNTQNLTSGLMVAKEEVNKMTLYETEIPHSNSDQINNPHTFLTNIKEISSLKNKNNNGTYATNIDTDMYLMHRIPSNSDDEKISSDGNYQHISKQQYESTDSDRRMNANESLIRRYIERESLLPQNLGKYAESEPKQEQISKIVLNHSSETSTAKTDGSDREINPIELPEINIQVPYVYISPLHLHREHFKNDPSHISENGRNFPQTLDLRVQIIPNDTGTYGTPDSKRFQQNTYNLEPLKNLNKKLSPYQTYSHYAPIPQYHIPPSYYQYLPQQYSFPLSQYDHRHPWTFATLQSHQPQQYNPLISSLPLVNHPISTHPDAHSLHSPLISPNQRSQTRHDSKDPPFSSPRIGTDDVSLYSSEKIMNKENVDYSTSKTPTGSQNQMFHFGMSGSFKPIINIITDRGSKLDLNQPEPLKVRENRIGVVDSPTNSSKILLNPKFTSSSNVHNFEKMNMSSNLEISNLSSSFQNHNYDSLNFSNEAPSSMFHSHSFKIRVPENVEITRVTDNDESKSEFKSSSGEELQQNFTSPALRKRISSVNTRSGSNITEIMKRTNSESNLPADEISNKFRSSSNPNRISENTSEMTESFTNVSNVDDIVFTTTPSTVELLVNDDKKNPSISAYNAVEINLGPSTENIITDFIYADIISKRIEDSNYKEKEMGVLHESNLATVNVKNGKNLKANNEATTEAMTQVETTFMNAILLAEMKNNDDTKTAVTNSFDIFSDIEDKSFTITENNTQNLNNNTRYTKESSTELITAHTKITEFSETATDRIITEAVTNSFETESFTNTEGGSVMTNSGKNETMLTANFGTGIRKDLNKTQADAAITFNKPSELITAIESVTDIPVTFPTENEFWMENVMALDGKAIENSSIIDDNNPVINNTLKDVLSYILNMHTFNYSGNFSYSNEKQNPLEKTNTFDMPNSNSDFQLNSNDKNINTTNSIFKISSIPEVESTTSNPTTITSVKRIIRPDSLNLSEDLTVYTFKEIPFKRKNIWALHAVDATPSSVNTNRYIPKIQTSGTLQRNSLTGIEATTQDSVKVVVKSESSSDVENEVKMIIKGNNNSKNSNDDPILSKFRNNDSLLNKTKALSNRTSELTEGELLKVSSLEEKEREHNEYEVIELPKDEYIYPENTIMMPNLTLINDMTSGTFAKSDITLNNIKPVITPKVLYFESLLVHNTTVNSSEKELGILTAATPSDIRQQNFSNENTNFLNTSAESENVLESSVKFLTDNMTTENYSTPFMYTKENALNKDEEEYEITTILIESTAAEDATAETILKR